jgi:hypothetical protein
VVPLPHDTEPTDQLTVTTLESVAWTNVTVPGVPVGAAVNVTAVAELARAVASPRPVCGVTVAVKLPVASAVNEHVVVALPTAEPHDPDPFDPFGPTTATLYTRVEPLPHDTEPTDQLTVTTLESVACDNVTAPGVPDAATVNATAVALLDRAVASPRAVCGVTVAVKLPVASAVNEHVVVPLATAEPHDPDTFDPFGPTTATL